MLIFTEEVQNNYFSKTDSNSSMSSYKSKSVLYNCASVTIFNTKNWLLFTLANKRFMWRISS